MHFVKKINLKRYFLIGIVLTGLMMPLLNSNMERIVAWVIFFATCLNHFFLVEIISELTFSRTIKDYQIDNVKIVALFSAKMIILVLALILGVQLMGKRVLLPLMNYVVQIFVLAKSLKTDTKV